MLRRFFAGAIGLVGVAVLTTGVAWAGAGGGCSTGDVTVPEPLSLALLGAGVAGILVVRARRNKK